MDHAGPTHHAHIQAVYRAHHGWLRAMLQRKLGNAFDAADIAHDTFERMIRAQHHDALNEPRAYLRTIATRLLIDRSRRQALEAAYSETLALTPEAVEPAPEHRLQVLETLEQICKLLDQLPMTCRQVFLLAQIEGLSYAQIGEQLGMTPNAVQKSLARALVRCYAVVYD